MGISQSRIGSFREILPDHLGVDVRALAAFRMGLGLVLLTDVWLRAFHVPELLADGGVLPRASLVEVTFPWRMSPFMWSGEAWVQGVLLACTAVAAVALLAGIRTRVATVVCWMLLASLHVRNPHILQGGDDLLLVLLFWSMFLPLGAACSVDRALDSSDDPPPRRIVNMATAALLLQVLFVYVFTAVHKLHPVWVPEGRAVQYALMLEQFVTPWAAVALQAGVVLQVATWATLLFEFVAPLALLGSWLPDRARLALVLGFIGLHLGFVVFLRIGLFPFISIVGWIPFVPSFAWDRMAEWVRGTHRGPTLRLPRRVPRRPLRWRIHTVTEVVVLVLIGYTAAWNVTSLGPRSAVPDGFAWLAERLKIDQSWRMFAPYPLDYSGRVYAAADLASGDRIVTGPTTGVLARVFPRADEESERLLFWKSEYIGRIRLATASAPYYRWRKFHQRIIDEEELRADYTRFLCRDYGRRHPGLAGPGRMALVLVRHDVSHRTHDWDSEEQEVLFQAPCAPSDGPPDTQTAQGLSQ